MDRSCPGTSLWPREPPRQANDNFSNETSRHGRAKNKHRLSLVDATYNRAPQKTGNQNQRKKTQPISDVRIRIDGMFQPVDSLGNNSLLHCFTCAERNTVTPD
jgi:hypothetical protein